MIPKYRLWFEDENGNYLIGEGLYLLLKKIKEHGNLSNAVKSMNMSYRNGWGKIRDVEERTGRKIIETKRGGAPRGETKLTEFGEELLNAYQRYDEVINYYMKRPYKIPSLTVDGVLIEKNMVLLIKRRDEPYRGYYALPGGFVEYGETVEEALLREMKEELSISVKILSIIGIYSSPERDPRGHTISIAYLIERTDGSPKPGDDAAEIKFFDMKKLPRVAFDHSLILTDALKIFKSLNQKA